MKKSMLFGVLGPRETDAQPLQVELNGERLPVQHEFRQPGVGVRTTTAKGDGGPTGGAHQLRQASTAQGTHTAGGV